MGILILSPHCDDAPFSMGASLLAHTFGSNVDVHVVFSVSRHTRLTDGPRTTKEVTHLRKEEESRVGSLAGYIPTFWDLPEPSVRRSGVLGRDIFNRHAVIRDDAVWPNVVGAFRQRLAGHSWQIVFIPLGCGGHIDHRIVRDAAIDYFASLSGEQCLGFYEDLPYAGYLPLDNVDRLVKEMPRQLAPCPIAEEFVHAKIALLMCYRSQLSHADLRAVRVHAARRHGECVWLTPSSGVQLEK